MAEFTIKPRIEGHIETVLTYAEARALAKMAEWDHVAIWEAVCKVVSEGELTPYRAGFMGLLEKAGAFRPVLDRINDAHRVLAGQCEAVELDTIERLRRASAEPPV